LQLLNGLRALAAQAGVMICYSLGRLFFILGLLTLGTGLLGAVAGLLLAAVTAAALAIGLLLSQPREPADATELSWTGEVVPWIKYACGYEILSFVLLAMNLWIVQAQHAGHPQLSVYAASTMMARAVSPLGLVLAGGTFAQVARAYHTGDHRQLHRLLAGGCELLAALLIPANLMALVYGSPLLRAVCGPAYGGGGLLCGLLVAGTSLATCVFWLGEMLGAAHQLLPRLVVNLLGFVVLAPLTVVLSLRWELLGAAWAMVVGYGFLALAMGGVVRYTLGPFLRWRALLRTAAVNAAALAATLALGPPADGAGLLAQVLLSLTAFGIAFGVVRYFAGK
jgi:O-antigen/teichoic acid export membrane protein